MATESPIFVQRQESLRAAMRQEGLGALVIFGMSPYTGPSYRSHPYLRYLSGWTGRFTPSMLLLPAEGPTTLVVPSPFDYLRVGESFPWIGRCLLESTGSYGRVARRELQGMGAERAGLVGCSEMPYSVYQDLMGDGGPPALTPAEHLVDAMRLVKDEGEMENHRQAARISDQMMSTLVERLRGYGGPAWRLQVEMEHTARSLGAEFVTTWLVAGQPADRPRYLQEENEREVRPGDQVAVGTFVTYRGYWGHCVRMGAVGAPSEEHRSLYAMAMEQHRAAVARIRVGEPAWPIEAEAERVAEGLLPGALAYPARFRYAHLLGLDYSEKPTAEAFPEPGRRPQPGSASEVLLRPGMLMEVHTNLGLGGLGFGSIGDMYLVREEGPERVTQFPQNLFVV